MVQGYSYLQLQHIDSGLSSLSAAKDEGVHPAPLMFHASVIMGDTTIARQWLDSLIAYQDDAEPYDMAQAHNDLGDTDLALDWLEKAYEKRVAQMPGLGTDPEFANLREEPRFMEIVNKVGLIP